MSEPPIVRAGRVRRGKKLHILSIYYVGKDKCYWFFVCRRLGKAIGIEQVPLDDPRICKKCLTRWQLLKEKVTVNLEVDMSDKKFYGRSVCCNALWELVFQNSKWHLECYKCGKVGPSIEQMNQLTFEELVCLAASGAAIKRLLDGK